MHYRERKKHKGGLKYNEKNHSAFSTDIKKSLNNAIVKEILCNRYGKGSLRIGIVYLVFGLVYSTLFALSWIIPNVEGLLSIWGIVYWIVNELIGGFLIWRGISKIRKWNQNELQINSENYYLKESIIVDYKEILDCDRADQHIFTFDNGKEISSTAGLNCDRMFNNCGKIGDKCYLLFFDFHRPGNIEYVFDARWWELQPDMMQFLK